MFYLLNSHSILRSALSPEGLFGNRSVLIVIAVCTLPQIAYVHTGPMQVVFHSTHLTFERWFKVVLVGAFVFAFRRSGASDHSLLQRKRHSYRAAAGQERSFNFAL